jgi:predicted N-acetyltransferase YhbS
MSQVSIRTMRQGEREPVLDLLEGAFGFREIFARYMQRDPLLQPEDTLLALVDDTPISCVQIFSKRIRLRGETLPLGGVGSVATATSHRRQGLGSELLRRALEEMERRGMALALLFADLVGFYERLGFVSVPQRRWLLHRPPRLPDPPVAVRFRAFVPEDLPAVRDLYDEYGGAFEASTVRDPSYWEGQLGYAGNPDEDFRVAVRGGRVVAYARVIEIRGATAATEFGRAASAAADLAALLLALAPASHPLICPRPPDPELDEALERAGALLQPMRDPETLWRVLDRPALLRLSALPGTRGDEELLVALVGGPRALYWPSDRF